MSDIDTDLCIIGAGSGGLVVAAGAVQMGARVVLIERAKMGGDCLNYGCVPSKALIAAATAAQAMREAGRFGVKAVQPEIDFAAVMDHVHGVIAAIAPVDSVERFSGLGVRVLQEDAKFIDARTVRAGPHVVRAKRFVIATGSHAGVPPIPGLAEAPYLTNETIFDNRVRPDHLIVIGGGPIGLEMAQAHRRLGSEVTVLEAQTALAKDDPELAEVVKAALRREGVRLLEQVAIERVEAQGGGIAVLLKGGERIAGSHLLVAAGRVASVDGLGLEQAGVEYDRKGVKTDARLRSSQKHIYAVGDVAGRLQFTHVAAQHAGIVLRNALFRLPARVDENAVPWCTYTEPELAQIGMTEAQARKKFGDDVVATRFDYKENDRAQAERATEGFVKVISRRNGRVLGAGIVGRHAGELIQGWGLPVAKGMKLSAVAGLVLAYPTLSEISKRAAGNFYGPKIFNDRVRAVVRFLLRLP